MKFIGQFKLEMPEALLRRLAENEARGPYPCRGGCGSPVKYSDSTCRECEDQRYARQMTSEVIRSARIPSRFLWARFDRPEIREVVSFASAVDRMAKISTKDSAVIGGPTGSGKTVLACAWLAHVIAEKCLVVAQERDPEPVRFARFIECGDLIGPDRKPDTGLIWDAIGADVVVLDELGVGDIGGATADWEVSLRAEPAQRILMARHNAGKPTVVTTGLTPDQLLKIYSPPVHRRLMEDAERQGNVFALPPRKEPSGVTHYLTGARGSV